MIRRYGRLVYLWVAACLLLSACGQSSLPNTGKVQPVKVEEIDGSKFKRVTLTEKAAERIDIQTAPVRQEQLMRKRMVGGEVVTAASLSGLEAESAQVSSSGSTSAAVSPLWVRVRLNEGDLNEVDRAQSAKIRLLTGEDDDDEDGEDDLEAEPDDALDTGEEDDALYYSLNGSDNGLAAGQRVFVEISLAGNAALQLVIPYSAVVYGLEGESWVYTNPERLVFVRQPIQIDYISGDQAILTEGPPVGTQLVVVGAAELYGAETGVSK